MHVIALATQKGGTGKSSLAVSLAVAAEEQGLRSMVLDMDPQATALGWYQRRTANGNPQAPAVAQMTAAGLKDALRTLEGRGADLVFLDTAGVDSPATVAAMGAADLCIIPARPSTADIEAARPTIASIGKLGKPFAFLLSQSPAGKSIRTNDASRFLELSGAVCNVAVAMRADHLDAMAIGQGVTERDPNGKAAAEVRGVLKWILNRTGAKANGQQEAHFAA